MCDMSKKRNRQVTRRLKMVTNIIRRKRPASGSINRPTLTVPDEQRQARQAIQDTCNVKKKKGKYINHRLVKNHLLNLSFQPFGGNFVLEEQFTQWGRKVLFTVKNLHHLRGFM